MHFTTRCSACGTLFRIGNDQLKVSDGWARCGCCHQVFDATLSLQASLEFPGSAPSISAALMAQAAVPAAEPTPVAQPDREMPVADRPLATSTAALPTESVTAASLLNSQQSHDVPDVPDVPDAPAGVAALGDRSVPGFVLQARRRAFWRSPGIRAALLILVLALSLLMAGQWAFHHRDRLAASVPALAPPLAQVCAELGCQLSPLRRLESIVIDSTTLVRRLDNFYVFDIVLKNTGATALAMPALELTLTRADDTVMARRVFLPQELSGVTDLVPANASTTLSLRLSIGVGEGQAMAGYRALIFYP